MRLINVRYVLHTGQRGVLHTTARTTADAVLITLDTFGAGLRMCATLRGAASAGNARHTGHTSPTQPGPTS